MLTSFHANPMRRVDLEDSYNAHGKGEVSVYTGGIPFGDLCETFRSYVTLEHARVST